MVKSRRFEEILDNMDREDVDSLFVSSSNLQLFGIGANQMLLHKIYRGDGREFQTDTGVHAFVVKDKKKDGLLIYILAKDIERGNLNMLIEERKISNPKILFYGGRYFTLDNYPKLSDLSEHIKSLIGKHKISKIAIEESYTPYNIYKVLENIKGVRIVGGASKILDNVRLDTPLTKEQTSLYKRASVIGNAALNYIRLRVEELDGNKQLSEASMHEMIKKCVRGYDGRLLFNVIHVDHTHPRLHSKKKVLNKENPFVKIDLGVEVSDPDGNRGLCDLCDTFFINEKFVEHVEKERFQKAKTLYSVSRFVVEGVAKMVRPGMSGKTIHSKAQKLLEKKANEFRMIGYEKVPTLGRNIGHWIRDYVEGQPFVPSQNRRLKKGDIICLELPIGDSEVNISPSYEIEGIVTKQGLSVFK